MQVANPYVRLSKKDRDAVSLSPSVQLQTIVDYCRYKCWKVGTVYQDIGVSGGVPLAQRPQGALLIAEIALRPGIVVCARQDRLFRDSEDAIVTINDWRRRDILPVCLAEGLDLSTPAGRMMFSVMASMAQYERELTGERTRIIMAEKKERGDRVSKYPPFGYKFHPTGKKARDGRDLFQNVPCPEELQVIATMKADVQAGKSLREIADKLNERGIKPRKGIEWGHTSVRSVLNQWKGRNPLKVAKGSDDTTRESNEEDQDGERRGEQL